MSLPKRIAKFLLTPWIRSRGPRGGIYLTFDDGPNVTHTRAMLAVLRRYNVKATFFMVGEEMERHPDIVEEVRAQGHAIGFHSYRHRHVSEHTGTELLDDLHQTAAVAQRFGIDFKLYRPPYGELSWRRVLWCVRHGVRIVMWSLESRDSFIATPEELIQQLAPGRVRDGDIILLHDDTAVTVTALPAAIEGLQIEGFRFGVLTRASA
jgi:peptidoglycan-N-acetylglucosamine deacetylase